MPSISRCQAASSGLIEQIFARQPVEVELGLARQRGRFGLVATGSTGVYVHPNASADAGTASAATERLEVFGWLRRPHRGRSPAWPTDFFRLICLHGSLPATSSPVYERTWRIRSRSTASLTC